MVHTYEQQSCQSPVKIIIYLSIHLSTSHLPQVPHHLMIYPPYQHRHTHTHTLPEALYRRGPTIKRRNQTLLARKPMANSTRRREVSQTSTRRTIGSGVSLHPRPTSRPTDVKTRLTIPPIINKSVKRRKEKTN